MSLETEVKKTKIRKRDDCSLFRVYAMQMRYDPAYQFERETREAMIDSYCAVNCLYSEGCPSKER